MIGDGWSWPRRPAPAARAVPLPVGIAAYGYNSIGSEPYSPDDEELDRLPTLVEIYEDEHYPMEKPDPASALKFLLDQQMVSPQRMLALPGDLSNRDAIIAGEQPIPRV